MRLWLTIVGLGVTQIIGWGTLFYPPAVIAAAMGRDSGTGPQAAFWGITVVMLAGALSSSRIGALIDRQGARGPLAAGCVVTALALALLSAASTPLLFWTGWVVLGLVSPLVLSTGAYAAMVRAAGRHARRAVSALTLFSGLASTVFYPATQALAGLGGWRLAYLVFAGLHLAICLPICLSLRTDTAREPVSAEAAGAPTLSGARARRAFWLFAGVVMLNTVVSSGLTLHLIHIFGLLGLAAPVAVAAASLTGPSQVAARAVEIVIGQRYPALATAVTATVLQGVSLALLLVWGQRAPVIWVFVVVYGVSNGLMAIARAAVPLSLFGRDRYGAMAGRLNVAFSITTAVAPAVFSSVLSAFGPRPLIGLCAGLAAGAMGIVIALFRVARTETPDRAMPDAVKDAP